MASNINVFIKTKMKNGTVLHAIIDLVPQSNCINSNLAGGKTVNYQAAPTHIQMNSR